MFKSRIGYIPDTPQQGDVVLQAQVSALSGLLPEKVDLRKQMPLAFFQGILNSCVQNTVAAAYALCAKRQGLKKSLVSRLYLYWFARQMNGAKPWENAPTRYRDTFSILQGVGAPSEWLWPYLYPIYPIKPMGFAAKAAKKNLAVTWDRVNLDETSVKATLAAGYPVLIGFSIPESMDSWGVRLTGDLKMPEADEPNIGGHAAAIVGYDDATRKYLIRNSWGFWWGLLKLGHFTVPYQFVNGPKPWAGEGWALREVK
jgi:hypothetical protein